MPVHFCISSSLDMHIGLLDKPQVDYILYFTCISMDKNFESSLDEQAFGKRQR